MFVTGLGHLCGGVVRVCAGGHSGRPVRGPRRPGPRRSDALACGPRDHHDRLPGQPAGEGPRRLGSSRRRRRSYRRPRRRCPHRVQRLADDLLRQSSGRCGARGRRTEDRSGRHAEAALAGARPAWSGARDNEPRRHRLRDHPGRAASAGRPSRRCSSASAASWGSLPSQCASGTPTRRSCGSSGWRIVQSAAASS